MPAKVTNDFVDALQRFGDEFGKEVRNLLAPGGERGNLEDDHAEPVEKVAAKPSP